MSIDINQFDFGFTAVDENELEAVQKTTTKLQSTSSKVDINLPLLNNLVNSFLCMEIPLDSLLSP